MHHILGVTGTPGTGKKSMSPLVGRIIGVPTLGLNDLARDEDMMEDDAVDARALAKVIRTRVQVRTIVFGHLAQEVIHPDDLQRIVVLRCEPRVLKKRLISRGYPPEKVRSNVEAELIGLIAHESYKKYGKDRVLEFDSTSSHVVASSRRLATLLLSDEGGPRIDWAGGYASSRKLGSLLSTSAP